MPRSEIVAKICSNCDHFSKIEYNCPYINDFIKAKSYFQNILENCPELDMVSLQIGCKAFKYRDITLDVLGSKTK